jgi:hypothetical protein
MRRTTKKPAPRRWRASLIRKRTEFLGRVEAPDRDAAIAKAIDFFGITDPERQRRVIVRPIADSPVRRGSF